MQENHQGELVGTPKDSYCVETDHDALVASGVTDYCNQVCGGGNCGSGVLCQYGIDSVTHMPPGKVPRMGKIWHNADNQAEAEQWRVDLLAKGATHIELKPEADRRIVSVIITLERSRANEILGYEVGEDEWLDLTDDEPGKLVEPVKQPPKPPKVYTYADGLALMVLAADKLGLAPSMIDVAKAQLNGQPVHPTMGAYLEKEASRVNELLRQQGESKIMEANAAAQELKVEYGFLDRPHPTAPSGDSPSL